MSDPTPPKIKFWAALDMVTEPPLKVTLPLNTNSVVPPDEFSCTFPSCVYVPASNNKPELFAIDSTPPAELLIVPPKKLLKPEATAIVPVALLVIVPRVIAPLFNCKVPAPVTVTFPPWMVELFTWTVLALARIVPPALLIVPVLCRNKTLPPVASTVPVFVNPLVWIVSPDDAFELMIPELTSVNPLMRPAP